MPPPQKIGPYVVEGVLGKGCMGVVYKVRHPKLGKYALKVLRSELSSRRDLQRFKREIEMLAAVSEHPHVVKIHTAAEERGRIYYVMDLVQGEDLQAKLKHGPLPPATAARYVKEIAGAVAVLHQKGILHRDIKPANVIIDERDRARLSDFGLARSFTDEQSRLTLSGEFVGTPLFMAPEQATGGGAGTRSDVYALGMVLYTLIAGQPAIQGSSTAEVLQKLRAGGHRPLRKLAPDVSPVLADLVMRTLSMDPRARPKDAGMLARELERFVEQKEAEQVGAQEKRKLIMALIFAVAVVLSVSLVALAVLTGGDGGASVAASGGDQLDATLEAAQEAVAGNDPVPEGLFARLDAARVALGPVKDLSNGDQGKLGELWALEGELRLRAGEIGPARACLAAAEEIADPDGPSQLRNLARRGLGALRAGLGAVDPQPDDELVPLLTALQAAERLYPDRMELLDWRVAIAVRFERWEDADKALQKHPVPDRIASTTRMKIYLALEDLSRAEGLAGEVDDRALIGELRYRQGLSAVTKGEWQAARDYFAEAVEQDPEGAMREETTEALRALYGEHSDWSRGIRGRRLAKMVEREVAVARALNTLDPDFTLPRKRYDLVFRSMPEVGRALEHDTLQVLENLVVLRPDDLSLYKLYGEVAQEWYFPNAERELEILRAGFAKATHPRDKEQLAKSLGAGYYFGRELQPLIELEASLPEGVSDSRRAYLLGRAGDLLRWQGNLSKAKGLLDRAAELDRDSHEVALFSYWLAKAQLSERMTEEARQAAITSGWRFLENYPGFGWHEDLPELCGWLAKVEAARDDPDQAVRALNRLLEYRPDQVQWAAYRAELLAQQDPWPESLTKDVDALAKGIEHAIQYVTGAAQAASGDRRETLRKRIDAVRKVSVQHLGQAVAIGDREGLLRGLRNLQTTLRPLLDDVR